MKKTWLILIVLLCALRLSAQTAPLQGFCTIGGQKVTTSGLSSSNPFMGSYPLCQVTVYLTGTTTKATIYADKNNTALANPFTATAIGSWIFYAATGQGFDVVLNGGTPSFPSPFTLVALFPASGSGPSGNPAGVNGQNQINLNGSFGVVQGLTTSQASGTAPGIQTVPQLVISNGEEDVENGIFSDLATAHDGGVANPTDGSTGNALQAALTAAGCWSNEHGGASATVIMSSLFPVSGSRIFIPSNVALKCSTILDQTYSAACVASQTDLGNNTSTGGSPLFQQDFTFTANCGSGVVTLGGNNSTLDGVHMYGGGNAAGGQDVGDRIAADNVSVRNTVVTGFFGGPVIEAVGSGVNNSYDWNYATNNNGWFCANGASLTTPTGAMIVGIDSEASYNQLSTGCGFSKSFRAGAEYPNLGVMYVAGEGATIAFNLLQADEIAIILAGQESRIIANRFEFMSREGVRVEGVAGGGTGNAITLAANHITSPCLDPALNVSALFNCFGVYDNGDGGTAYSANRVEVEAAVDGPSYIQGSYNVVESNAGAVISSGSNTCAADSRDSYGNGQCYWSGTNDPYANGGPAFLGNNGNSVAGSCVSGFFGCQAWVGDYKKLVLTDATSQTYAGFVGMALGQDFYVQPQKATTIIPHGSLYGNPGMVTCDGYPFTMSPNVQYHFFYGNDFNIYAADCVTPQTTYLEANYNGQTAPSNKVQGVISGFGNANLFRIASIANPSINMGSIPAGSYQDCYRMVVYAAGAELSSTSDQCTLYNIPTPSTPHPIGLSVSSAPNAITEVLLYRSSTTDPSLSTGLIVDSVGSSVSLSDVGQAVISSPVAANGINTSARLNFGGGTIPPTGGATPCNTYDLWFGTDGNLYFCTSSGSAKKVTAATP